MKLTKIIATIGPASADQSIIRQLILSGVNIFRFNFKHNTPDWHLEYIKLVKKVADDLALPIGILADLQGPSIRVNIPFEEISFASGELLPFGSIVFEKNIKGLSISHPQILSELHDGEEILCADGKFSFIFKKIDGQFFVEAKTDGTLLNNKNVNIPGSNFTLPVLIEKDFTYLEMISHEYVDFVAASFVRSRQDIIDVRTEMNKRNITAKIIAKIETHKSIENIDEIINEADIVMVARGDLGVELPIHEIPFHQKNIIKKCIELGVPVITATQMLESMMNSLSPTRAEVSDIANATYDLTDAVMLSGESAFGKYPKEAVSLMAQTIISNEQRFTYDIRTTYQFESNTDEAHVVEMAYNLYLTTIRSYPEKFAGFIVFTKTGNTARLLSRYRPCSPIFAYCPDNHVVHQLTINFGVYPGLRADGVEHSLLSKNDIQKAIKQLMDEKRVQQGDKLIVIHGDYWGHEGGTNTVKLLTV